VTRSGNTLWIHVAAARYILADHEPGAPTEIISQRRYWTSRLRAICVE